MMFLERHLVFFPAAYPVGNWQPRGLAVEDAWIYSDDGEKLHGWFAGRDRPKAVVLVMSGNAGNVTQWADDLKVLRDELQASVLAFDYRGYGRSEGTPDEASVLADARSARAWLASRAGVAEADIVLLGRSMGGGVAVDLASRDGARGLVLQSTFTSLPDVAAHHYPWLPVRLLMKTRFDSLAKIGDYAGPLLQMHGDADEIVPIEQGRRLFDAAQGDKRFLTISGGRHNDPPNGAFYRVLAAFLDDLP